LATADAVRPAARPERVAGARPAYVLLVEDHEINQEIARTVIEAAGHRVDVVGDGAAAVEAVRQTTYDVVLMDVQMPVMDGVTATRRIRALNWPVREVPIIAMTANVLPAQVAELRAAGADDHVGKPFKRLDLYAAIDRWSGRDRPIGDTLAVDRTVYDNLAGVLGDAVLGGRVQTLADQLSSTFGSMGPGKDRAQLAQDARAMSVAMGELGCVELADLMRSLEASCAVDQPLEALLGRIASATRRALTEIAGIRSAA
jgi:CheY-like chemotaxis protein